MFIVASFVVALPNSFTFIVELIDLRNPCFLSFVFIEFEAQLLYQLHEYLWRISIMLDLSLKLSLLTLHHYNRMSCLLL
jgi:hypothetical protein